MRERRQGITKEEKKERNKGGERREGRKNRRLDKGKKEGSKGK